jgi:hypothetical protein
MYISVEMNVKWTLLLSLSFFSRGRGVARRKKDVEQHALFLEHHVLDRQYTVV